MNIEKATFGGGCFWEVEKYFKEIPGVLDAVPGFAGGTFINPDYSDVCSGRSGHAEVVDVNFDAQVISYSGLVELFLKEFGSTEVGNADFPKSNYRSIILFRNMEQEKAVKDMISEYEGKSNKKITTELVPLDCFYKAEDYH